MCIRDRAYTVLCRIRTVDVIVGRKHFVVKFSSKHSLVVACEQTRCKPYVYGIQELYNYTICYS